MVIEVDDDGSGCIEFPEFLNIIKNSGSDPNSSAAEMVKFFK
jgi:Ca2+-binding EF-hand superfamily protein